MPSDHAGFLQKRSPKPLIGWQSRWFAFKDDKLRYYRQKPATTDSLPAGELNLHGALWAWVGDGHLEFTIQIAGSDHKGRARRIYRLRASSAQEGKKWCEEFAKALRFAAAARAAAGSTVAKATQSGASEALSAALEVRKEEARRQASQRLALIAAAARLIVAARRARSRLKAMVQHTSKAGYLVKRGGSGMGLGLHRKSWKRRYFVVCDDQCALHYYESDGKLGKADLLGSFDLRAVRIVDAHSVGAKGSQPSALTFSLADDARKEPVVIEAASADDRAAWLESLRFCADYYNSTRYRDRVARQRVTI